MQQFLTNNNHKIYSNLYGLDFQFYKEIVLNERVYTTILHV